MTRLRLLLPILLATAAGCSTPMPRSYERLPVAGEAQLDEVACIKYATGLREVRLRFRLPDTDYDYGLVELVDPELQLSDGEVDGTGGGSTIASGSETLSTNLQVMGHGKADALTSLSSRVEVLLLGARQRAELPSWDAAVGKAVQLPDLPGQLEVLEWSPSEARFRCSVPFPEFLEFRVSDENVAKSMISRGTLVEEHVGEWHIRFDVPCPSGTTLAVTYPSRARRLSGRVELGATSFRDFDPKRDYR